MAISGVWHEKLNQVFLAVDNAGAVSVDVHQRDHDCSTFLQKPFLVNFPKVSYEIELGCGMDE